MSNAAEKRHLERVRALGCIVCGGAAIAHHIRTGTSSGTGMKATDYQTIPLCNFHHTDGPYGAAYHKGAERWQQNFGYEVDLLDQVLEELGITC